ncbi:MAG: biotin transporter BioY, partial [Clostridia bacterium]|nr:biotin transporter BioY [Clostridia bacterium]
MYDVAKKSRKFPTKSLILTALFVALLAVSARVSFPFFLVPFTLQVLFVLLAGKLCGKLVGGLTVAIYILLGLAGLPFFTAGGGFEYVLKPSFGYIIG